MTERGRFNPFPGLRPFDSDETHVFFGREGQSDELLRRLRENRFLAVVGTSGSGKSSLMRAGLLPSLYSGLMRQAGSGWRVAIFRPGNDPIGNLARALGAPDVLYHEETELRATVIEAGLRRGALGLVEVVAEARLPADENLLVVVDQFEELFRLQRTTAERDHFREDAAAFVKLLLEASAQQRVAIYIALTMRSDYLGDCSQFRDLPEAINRGQYLIPRMTRDEQRLAITGPVAVGGAEIAPRLVNRLLNDVGDNPDQLPTLQHALMRTWSYWSEHAAEGQPLDLEDYEAVGGMADALSRHADEAFAELPDARSREIAEKIFRRLTERGPDNREIRRPTTVAELCAVAEAPESEVFAVIEIFRRPGRSFLMPPTTVHLTPNTLIDISHESLIRGWGRLRGWVDEEAQSARTYRRLAETAELFNQGRAGLWRDPDLALALEWWNRDKPNAAWAKTYDPNFDEAKHFLENSRNVRDRDLAEAEEKRTRELRRTRAFVGVLSVLLVGSTALAIVAKQSEARALAAEKQLGMAALRESIDDQSHYGTLAAFAGNVMSVSVSPQYQSTRALALGYAGRHDSAVVEYSKALALEPEFPTARLNRCDEYLNLGKADSAVLDCEWVLKRWPHSPLVYLNLGVGYGMLGRYAAAAAYFDTAVASTRYQYFSGGQSVTAPSIQRVTGRETLALEGDEAATAFAYGRASMKALEGGDAFPKVLADADRQTPSLDAVLNALNWAWLTHREVPDSAVPRDYGAYAAEGAFWERAGALRGALDEARASYREFLDAYRRRPEERYADLAGWVRRRLWLHLTIPGTSRVAVQPTGVGQSTSALWLEATKLNGDGESDSAVKLLTRGLAKSPNDFELLVGRAAILYGKNSYDSLRADAERILAIDSLFADGYFYRAFANWKQDAAGKRVAILADLDRCLTYVPTHFGALAISYWVLQDSAPDAALTRLERANQVDPGEHWIAYQMAVTQNRLKRYADARKSSEAAIALKRDSIDYYWERWKAETGLGMAQTDVELRLASGYREAGNIRAQRGQRELAAMAYVFALSRVNGKHAPFTPASEELRKDVMARLATLGPDASAYGTAWGHYWQKRYDRALGAIDTAIAVRGDYAAYYSARATFDSAVGRPAQWARDLTKLGDLQLQNGNKDGAWTSYFTAGKVVFGPSPAGDAATPEAERTALAGKMSNALLKFFGTPHGVATWLTSQLADSTWPQVLPEPTRSRMRDAMKAEITRLTSTDPAAPVAARDSARSK
ncbi:MAG TPA: hypothetical protein VEI06_00075 [Gemmatimonadaceae bacterium]|nr:hypothetical protein [Gemmatimonadaceae bacterium]